MLKLIITDLDSNLLSAWSKVFQGLSEVVFINIDFKTLVKYPEVDAVLIRWIFAHERYGGTPKSGQSQILSTDGETGMSPWVVTTPALHLDETYVSEEYNCNEFSRVLESIEQFNKTEQEPKIQTLGFEICFLYGFRSTPPYKEAEAVRRAYLEYYNEV